MNRAGRLFFQVNVKRAPGISESLIVGGELQALKVEAAIFFDENWHDAEKKGRGLLMALKSATLVIVQWK
jgi:hypothetical protein